MALNQAKETILNRLGHGRPGPKVSRYLKLYFIAQDVHERQFLALPVQPAGRGVLPQRRAVPLPAPAQPAGKACQALARAIRLRQPFDSHADRELALEDLQASPEHLRQQSNPAWKGLLRSLGALAANLTTLDRKLAGASNPDAIADEQDSALLDRSPRSTPRAPAPAAHPALLFRHGLRMAWR